MDCFVGLMVDVRFVVRLKPVEGFMVELQNRGRITIVRWWGEFVESFVDFKFQSLVSCMVGDMLLFVIPS